MITRIVVDASVLVSQLLSRDANHKPSLFWLNQFGATRGILVAPVFLQIEVAASIARLTGQPTLSGKAVQDMRRNNTIQFVPLDSALVQAAIDVASNIGLRAGDSIYVALAHQLGLPLITWDKEQLQKGANLVPTYTPLTYIFPTTLDEPEHSQ